MERHERVVVDSHWSYFVETFIVRLAHLTAMPT